MKIIQFIFGALKKFQKLINKPVVDTDCHVPSTIILIKVGGCYIAVYEDNTVYIWCVKEISKINQ